VIDLVLNLLLCEAKIMPQAISFT